MISLLPGSGLCTVNVPVTMTVPPTGMFPVHASPGLAQRRRPEVAIWSPIGTASSKVSRVDVDRDAVVRRLPGVGR